MGYSDKLIQNRRLETLVENQTTYAMQSAEMHLFETHQEASSVLLKFDQPVLASMLKGKKVMHLRDLKSFDFLPGESLVLPSSELMKIDFPEAQMENPTQCLAMTMCEDKVSNIISFLNETAPKADEVEWRMSDNNFHFTNDVAIHQIIHRLLFLFAEDHPSKDVFADFMLRELIMRILQTESQNIYSQDNLSTTSSRMAYVIDYIRKNLDQPLTVDKLSEKACMSESNFHKVFKNELGMSPIDFINHERIKLACGLLNDPSRKIKDVYLECGFNSLSYFARLFKRKKQVSPRTYQQQIITATSSPHSL